MTKRIGLFLAFLGAGAAFAQDSPKLQFEVASIRPSAQVQTGQVTAGVNINGSQMRCTALSLKNYVSMAYRVKVYQVEGPDWIASERFDISATIPAGVSTTKIPEMMQALLEDRFNVKLHRDKKEFPVYVLEVGKDGLKLKPLPPDPNAPPAEAEPAVNASGTGGRDGIAVDMGRGSSYSFANGKFEAKKVNADAAAGILEGFVDRPIVNMTNLSGNYDFAIDLTQEDYTAMLIRAGVNAGVVIPPQALRLLDGASLGSLFDGLEKIGLKLSARKSPLDILIIDSSLKVPTAN